MHFLRSAWLNLTFVKGNESILATSVKNAIAAVSFIVTSQISTWVLHLYISCHTQNVLWRLQSLWYSPKCFKNSNATFEKMITGTYVVSKYWNITTFVLARQHVTALYRPVTWTPGGRRVFWVWRKFFKLCPIFSNYFQHIFPGGAKFF